MQPEADETWPDLRPLDYQTQELAAHPFTRSRQLHGQGSGADLGLERLPRGFENQLFELVRRQAQTGGLLLLLKQHLTHVEAIAPRALVDADGAQRAVRFIEDQARQQGPGIELFGARALASVRCRTLEALPWLRLGDSLTLARTSDLLVDRRRRLDTS